MVKQHNKYDGTHKYWQTGKIGTTYQTYLDICKDIENSEIDDAEKDAEITKVL